MLESLIGVEMADLKMPGAFDLIGAQQVNFGAEKNFYRIKSGPILFQVQVRNNFNVKKTNEPRYIFLESAVGIAYLFYLFLNHIQLCTSSGCVCILTLDRLRDILLSKPTVCCS